jgi:hypothetical protein
MEQQMVRQAWHKGMDKFVRISAYENSGQPDLRTADMEVPAVFFYEIRKVSQPNPSILQWCK